MQTEARKRMIAARTTLVLDQPFFGALSLRLALLEDPSCKTAWTDGKTMGYSPDFIAKLTHSELTALVAHEVMHCAAGHPWRRDARKPRKWNVACDRVINPVLREAGFKLPEGALYELEPGHLGKSSEWVYDRLPDGDDGGEGDSGQGGGSGSAPSDGSGGNEDAAGDGSFGEVRDAPAGADQEGASEADWQQAVQQAANAAKSRGKLPSALDRFASEATEPRVDWRAALRRFIQEISRNDYTWLRPNTRYLAGGLYLPSLRSEEMGPIVVAVDTSGSIDKVLLEQFASELRSIVSEARPRRVYTMYCDARVHSIEIFEPDDVIELRAKGGGGTDFRPVFQALDGLEDDPSCVVYLTDLMGSFPSQEPDVPVLWASTSRGEAPFGETVHV